MIGTSSAGSVSRELTLKLGTDRIPENVRHRPSGRTVVTRRWLKESFACGMSWSASAYPEALCTSGFPKAAFLSRCPLARVRLAGARLTWTSGSLAGLAERAVCEAKPTRRPPRPDPDCECAPVAGARVVSVAGVGLPGLGLVSVPVGFVLPGPPSHSQRRASRAMKDSTSLDAEQIARALDKGRRSGEGWVACCPAHDDANPSLSVTDNPDGGAPLVHCHAGCSQDAVLGELKARGLWMNGADAELRRYEYHRADGTPHLTVCMYRDRLTGKKPDKRPWRDPRGVKGPHPLYRLRELFAVDPARTVLVVEGEHTCDAARDAWPGEAVVTWAGGCKSWRQTDWTPLRERTVTICARCGRTGPRRRAGHRSAPPRHRRYGVSRAP